MIRASSLKPKYEIYKQQKCFIGHSHEAEWHSEILSACAEVLPKYNMEPWYAADHSDPTVPLRDKVVELIANTHYGIYDLSYWRATDKDPWQMPRNVFIELGIAIALNRPTLLLRHASNQKLELPACLQSVGEPILDFSGEPTLKQALQEHLPEWLDSPPEKAWWNRFCIFGNRVCAHREAHPRTKQWGKRELHCHISDGPDVDRDDFRTAVEEVLCRLADVSFEYLDTLSPAQNSDFLLCAYCQTVRSTPFAIYRITPATTAETFIAIGMSLALENQFDCKIPKILLVDSIHQIPSLLTGYEVAVASSYKNRKARLRSFVMVATQKVRETVWRPRPLPFVETPIPAHTESVDLFSKQTLQVQVVSPSAGFLSIRSVPSTNHPPVAQVDHGTLLEVIESEKNARAKIGQQGQWLHVRTPDGIEGYTAAWYLQLQEEIDRISLHAQGARRLLARVLEVPLNSLDALPAETMSTVLRNLFEKMPPRSVRILQLRYGLINGRTYTQVEVSKKFGISRSRAQRIEAEATEQLRELGTGSESFEDILAVIQDTQQTPLAKDGPAGQEKPRWLAEQPNSGQEARLVQARILAEDRTRLERFAEKLEARLRTGRAHMVKADDIQEANSLLTEITKQLDEGLTSWTLTSEETKRLQEYRRLAQEIRSWCFAIMRNYELNELVKFYSLLSKLPQQLHDLARQLPGS